MGHSLRKADTKLSSQQKLYGSPAKLLLRCHDFARIFAPDLHFLIYQRRAFLFVIARPRMIPFRKGQMSFAGIQIVNISRVLLYILFPSVFYLHTSQFSARRACINCSIA